MNKTVEIKTVNTVKIQTIVDGKKTTRRRFNFEVELPKELNDIIVSYYGDVLAEVFAEQRSPEEWVKLIMKYTSSKQLIGWAASIIWWSYGGNEDNILYRLSKSYEHQNCKFKLEDVMHLLEKMECPRFICKSTTTREKERIKKIKTYIKNNQPVRLEEK